MAMISPNKLEVLLMPLRLLLAKLIIIHDAIQLLGELLIRNASLIPFQILILFLSLFFRLRDIQL